MSSPSPDIVPSDSVENVSANAASTSKITPQEYHKQGELCKTRPAYRQGRKLTAVKVYTINDESSYLLIIGVPSLKLEKELKKMCKQYGEVISLHPVPEYPSERFTETFMCRYACLKDSRKAKKNIDCRNFFGGSLHVCYAPELENPEDTRQKLIERRESYLKYLHMVEKNEHSSVISYHPSDKLSKTLEKTPSNLIAAESVSSINTERELSDASTCKNETQFNEEILGPSLGENSSYQSSNVDYEPRSDYVEPTAHYNIPHNSKKEYKQKNPPELIKSIKVYKKKTFKGSKTNAPFIGPKPREDKSLKSWNEVYDFKEHDLEHQKSLLNEKKIETLKKFEVSLRSLSTPPSQLIQKKNITKETNKKIKLMDCDAL